MIHRALLVAAVLGSLSLTACTGGFRATHMVERSGDHAVWLGNHDLAATEFGIVVERQPTRADARVKFARSLLETDRPNEAREQLEMAYTLKPADQETINLLSIAMVQSGDVEAATHMMRTRAEDQGRVQDWLGYGFLLVEINDVDGAETALLTAARGDLGQSLAPQLALAKFYQSVGDDETALSRLRMCLYIEPAHEEAQQMIRGYGKIPGPTFALQPTEQVDAATRTTEATARD